MQKAESTQNTGPPDFFFFFEAGVTRGREGLPCKEQGQWGTGHCAYLSSGTPPPTVLGGRKLPRDQDKQQNMSLECLVPVTACHQGLWAGGRPPREESKGL